MNRKTAITIVAVMVVGAVAFAGAFYLSDKSKKENEETLQRAADETSVRNSIARLSASHNAVEDWGQTLNSGGSTPQYSADLQSLLIRSDARPILFVGEVYDVNHVNGSYQCVFDGRAALGWRIRFFLNCDSDQARSAMKVHSGSLTRFAVVAQINSVARLEQGQSTETADKLSESTGFRADGRCVDLLSVGNYLGDIRDLLRDDPRK